MPDAITLEILDAAREVCGRDGFHADAKQIAKTAGHAEAVLYRRFPRRIALLEALVDEIIGDAEHRIVGILERYAGEPSEIIREMNRVGFEHVARYGRIASDITCGDIPPELGHMMPRVHNLWRFMGRTIKEGIEIGEFRKDVRPRIAVVAWRSLVSANALQAFRTDGGLMAPESMAEVVTTFLLSTLEAR